MVPDELIDSFIARLEKLMLLIVGDSVDLKFPFHILLKTKSANFVDRLQLQINKISQIELQEPKYIGSHLLAPILDCFTELEHQQEVATAVLFQGVLPVLDPEETKKLIDGHLKFRTHYTYSDTAVAGFLPDVITVDIEKEMKQAVASFQSIEQLRSYCFQNIQDIDLDLYYATPDLRSFRLQLDCSSSRSIDRCMSILKNYPELRHSQLAELIKVDAELAGRLPSYLQIELTTRSAVRPIVYPSVLESQDRNLSQLMIDKLIDDLAKFDLENDLTISLSGRGDPFEFDGLEDFVNRLIGLRCTKSVYIETPAVQITRTQIERLLNLKQVTLIIQLPTLNRTKYTKWMGAERLTDVLAFIDSIINKPVDASVYVEMIRLPDNEDELDEFMNRFSAEKTGGNVTAIIGKYSRYGETLPKLDVVDLSPLIHDYCRHLAYDMFLNADGRVPICRQHLDGGIPILEIDLASIFKARRKLYLYSVNNQYDQISPLCANCDDWYIFNA